MLNLSPPPHICLGCALFNTLLISNNPYYTPAFYGTTGLGKNEAYSLAKKTLTNDSFLLPVLRYFYDLLNIVNPVTNISNKLPYSTLLQSLTGTFETDNP